MELQLVSDFIDYYDCCFDRQAETVLYRKSVNDIDRHHMFYYITKMGYTPPLYGKVKTFKKYLNKNEYVVIYDNPYSHRSEGKKLVQLKDVDCSFDSEKLASVYIKSQAVSSRFLRIGGMFFELEYSSDDLWRSNYGNSITIKIIKQEYKKDSFGAFPLFAIDFVKSNDTYYAIDLNTSPGLRGTGIDDRLSPVKVVDYIKEWFEKAEYKYVYFKELQGRIND